VERESRLKLRNLDMIVFLAYVGVKVNRKTLLCKRSGGDMENRGSEDPHYKSGRGRDKIQEGRCLFCWRGDGAVRPEWYALGRFGRMRVDARLTAGIWSEDYHS